MNGVRRWQSFGGNGPLSAARESLSEGERHARQYDFVRGGGGRGARRALFGALSRCTRPRCTNRTLRLNENDGEEYDPHDRRKSYTGERSLQCADGANSRRHGSRLGSTTPDTLYRADECWRFRSTEPEGRAVFPGARGGHSFTVAQRGVFVCRQTKIHRGSLTGRPGRRGLRHGTRGRSAGRHQPLEVALPAFRPARGRQRRTS